MPQEQLSRKKDEASSNAKDGEAHPSTPMSNEPNDQRHQDATGAIASNGEACSPAYFLIEPIGHCSRRNDLTETTQPDRKDPKGNVKNQKGVYATQ
jgi:hypothetical protein